MYKTKLTVDEQIAYMKNVKGIKFKIITEDEAKAFLSYHNYYFKLKAYAKNYEKYTTGEKEGKYVDLEFAYLKELSTLDMHLRKFIIRLALDIEHFLRTQLLKDFTNNEDEDGYEIVKYFLSEYPEINDRINEKSNNAYCGELARKYYGCFALWNIIELLSFGDFTKLYELYYRKYKPSNGIVNCVFSVRILRNAAAHNNCLINRLRKPYSKEITSNKRVVSYISNVPGIGKEQRKNKMENPFIHDFVVMLYVFNQIVTSEQIKKHAMSELKEMIDDRFTREKDYFKKNVVLTSNYNFIKKIVDYFHEKGV